MFDWSSTEGAAKRAANKALNKATQALFATDSNFQKAALVYHSKEKPDGAPAILQFMFNPETITLERNSGFTEQSTQGATADAGKTPASQEWKGNYSRTLSVDNLYFDTYFMNVGKSKESKKANVRKYFVERLEKMMQAIDVNKDGKTFRPARVLFVWGEFMKDADEFNGNGWYITKVSTQYVMFLNDGTPVRAKVKLDLVEAGAEDKTDENSEKSAAQEIAVSVGDDGNAYIAIMNAGGSPADVLKICKKNGIDDPLDCKPGTPISWTPGEKL